VNRPSVLSLLALACSCTTGDPLTDVPGTIVVSTCDHRGDLTSNIQVATTKEGTETSARSNEVGRAELSLTAETYTVNIRGGGPDRDLPAVALQGQQTVELMDPQCVGPRQLPFKGAVAGDICNRHAGQWVGGAQVTLIATGGERRDTRTDAQGHFLLQNIPEGQARIRIRSTDGRYYKRITLDVTAQRVNWITTAETCTRLTPADHCTDTDDDGYGEGVDCIGQDCNDTDIRSFGECLDSLPGNVAEAESPTVLLLPRIQVSPAQLEFTGLLAGGQPRSTQITITNVGTGRLDFTGAVMTEPGNYASSIFTNASLQPLLPGESTMVGVSVVPPEQPATYETALLIRSNDDLTPLVRVPITCVVGQPPGFVLTPAVCEREVGVGRPGICEFSLLNTADTDLTVQAMGINLMSDDGFTAEDLQGVVVGRGTARTVRVINIPMLAQTYEGTVDITSNLGQTVSATARISGTGNPTAVIDVLSVAGIPVPAGSNPDVSPLDDVVLTSARSSAPPGRTLTNRRWELVMRPTDSTVVLTAGSSITSPTTAFTFNSSGVNRRGLDVAGTYVVGLVVTDNMGVASARATITLQAVPGSGVTVQLTWNHPSADIDLHLMRDPGPVNSPNDCYYANCKPGSGNRPIWDGANAAGEGGNPTLDVDDTDGIGPETITVTEALAGRYTVGVHVFGGSSGVGVKCNVKVFINSSLRAEYEKTLPNNRDFWTVADIMVPSSLVNEVDTVTTLP